MIEHTKCQTVLYSGNFGPIVQELQHTDGRWLRTSLEVPSVDTLLDTASSEHYEEQGSRAATEPVVVLHTSGSTGLPKPIPLTHGSLGVLYNYPNITAPPGRVTEASVFFSSPAMLNMAPFFHMMGVAVLRISICKSLVFAKEPRFNSARNPVIANANDS